MAKIISVRNPITKNIVSKKLIGAIETCLGFEDDCYKMVNDDDSFKTIFKTQVFEKLEKLKKRVNKKENRKSEAKLKKYDNKSIFTEYNKIANNYNNKLDVVNDYHSIKISGLKLDVVNGKGFDKLKEALSKSTEVKKKCKDATKSKLFDYWNDTAYNFHHFFQDLDVIGEYIKDHKERQKDKEVFLSELNKIVEVYNKQAMVWNNANKDLKINYMDSVK